MLPFKPQISRDIFIDTIMLEKEDPLRLSPFCRYKPRLAKQPRAIAYSSFMELCNKHAISYKCFSFIDKENSKETFKIIIYNDNASWYETTYFIKNEDIASKLTSNLADLLSIKLNNENFINTVIRNTKFPN